MARDIHKMPLLLNCLIGCSAAIQFAVISTFLQAVHGPFFTTAIKNVLAPVITGAFYLLARKVPPFMAAVPLVLITPIHLAFFPLADLIVLIATVSITAFQDRRSFSCTASAFFITSYLPVAVERILSGPMRWRVPSFLVALTVELLSYHSVT